MLSVILALVLVFSSLSAGLMAFAAEEKTGVVDLPEGVTEESANQVLAALDNVVKSEAVASLLSPGAKSLSDAVNKLISENLFNDAMVNEIVKAIYPMIQDTINNIENVPDFVKGLIFDVLKGAVGVYVRPADVASQIDGKYSAAKEAIAAAGDNWANVNWDNVKWGVTDRASFIDALGNALNGLNSVLRAALSGAKLEGQVKIGIPGLEVPVAMVKIGGCNAYADVILPLLQHLGADAVTVDEFKAGKSTVEMLGNILNPLLDRVDSLTSGQPLTEIVEVLPEIGYIVANQLHVTAAQKLVVTIGIGGAAGLVDWYTTQINVGDLLFNAMPQLKDAAGINELLKNAITSKVPGFVWNDIDFKKLSTLGEYKEVDNTNGGKSFEIAAYRADVLVTVLRYALETVRANQDFIYSQVDETVKGVLDTVFAMEDDQIISFLFSLFSPNYDLVNVEYNTPAIEKFKVDYGTQFTKEQIAQLVPALDGLIGTLLPGGLKSMISTNLYTNNIVNTLVKEAYSAIEGAGAEVSQVLSLLGIDVTPKGLASLLTEKEYAAAKAAFEKADSWADVDFSKVNYGFTDGDRAGFTNALVAVLRPVSGLLDFILTDENLVLFDAVTIKGGNGYNTAIIPLLEALGCTNIKTYDEYKKDVAADHDNLILDVINPILDLVESIAAKPLDGLTKILPNIAYFVDSDNLSVFVTNLIAPVNSLLVQAGFDVTTLYTDFLNNIDLDELINGLLPQVLPENIKIVLSNIDLHKVAALGTLTDFTSKRVDADGKFVASKKIVADQADVLVTVLRYVLGLLQIEENYNTVNNLLAGLLPENMVGMVTSILDMAKADPDSAIALIVSLLVGEGDGDGSGDGDGDTTVPGDNDGDGIVDGEGGSDVPTGDVAIAGFVATAVAAGAVLLIARKKKNA